MKSKSRLDTAGRHIISQSAFTAFGVMIMLPFCVPASIAQDGVAKPADPQRGHQLATVSCANCHLVPESGQTQAVAGVPSFRTIANRRDQTAGRLMGILVKPHQPMPQLQLTRDQIGDLIAYFQTLRQPAAGPSLVPKAKPERKATYPSPS